MLAIVLKYFVILILLINTVIWCFVPRETYCDVVKNFLEECPSHGTYLFFGIFSFIIAVIIAQFDYIKDKL